MSLRLAVAEMFAAIAENCPVELRENTDLREAARRLNVAVRQEEAFMRSTRAGLEAAERALRRRTWELNALSEEVAEIQGREFVADDFDPVADRCAELLRHWGQT